MQQFTAEFQNEYPSEDATKIEDRLRTLVAQKVASIDIRAISEVAATPSKLTILLQLGLRRVLELSEAAEVPTEVPRMRPSREAPVLLEHDWSDA